MFNLEKGLVLTCRIGDLSGESNTDLKFMSTLHFCEGLFLF